MFNRTYSLEETATTFDGLVMHPELCGACYQAITGEKRARSCPRSYAALAESQYTYVVMDWKGIGNSTCRCCGSNLKGERWSVEARRKVA